MGVSTHVSGLFSITHNELEVFTSLILNLKMYQFKRVIPFVLIRVLNANTVEPIGENQDVITILINPFLNTPDRVDSDQGGVLN
jgi:hypothetical protein